MRYGHWLKSDRCFQVLEVCTPYSESSTCSFPLDYCTIGIHLSHNIGDIDRNLEHAVSRKDVLLRKPMQYGHCLKKDRFIHALEGCTPYSESSTGCFPLDYYDTIDTHLSHNISDIDHNRTCCLEKRGIPSTTYNESLSCNPSIFYFICRLQICWCCECSAWPDRQCRYVGSFPFSAIARWRHERLPTAYL